MAIPTTDEIRQRRDAILTLAAKHGAKNVRLFGSVARGEADEQSDIDVLIDLEKGRTLFDLAALLVELEGLLQHKVDLVTEDGLREQVRAYILRDAVAL